MHLEWHPVWLLRLGMATRWTAPPRVSSTLSEISFEDARRCEGAVRNIFRRITGTAWRRSQCQRALAKHVAVLAQAGRGSNRNLIFSRAMCCSKRMLSDDDECGVDGHGRTRMGGAHDSLA
jgi:hypothetical protein